MDLRALAMGLAFAIIWSSAYATARVIVADAPPILSLAIRFTRSGGLALAVGLLMGQSLRLSRAQWRATLIFGLCQNAIYLGLNFVAMQWIEASLALLALAAALSLRPWRMLTGGLLTPWLATIVFLPLVWLLPQALPNGLAVQFSGACLLVLMVGWPLAVLALAVVAALVWALGALPLAPVLSQLVWVGLVPATLALLLGALRVHSAR